MATSPYHISSLLDKVSCYITELSYTHKRYIVWSSVFFIPLTFFTNQMGSVDKDFRFMATNDLMTELQKDSIKLDDDSEKKVVQSVLKLVEDKNGEVQNLAVKWFVIPLNKYVRQWRTV